MSNSLIYGGTAGTRTQDQSLKRALLYQLSYRPREARMIAELAGQFMDIKTGVMRVQLAVRRRHPPYFHRVAVSTAPFSVCSGVTRPFDGDLRLTKPMPSRGRSPIDGGKITRNGWDPPPPPRR